MIKVFEMFSGYGGASFALKKANIPYECIGISEIDKYAVQCFNNNFPNIKNYGDCREINPNDLPDFDLLTGGFPCQAFSVAGKGLGELDTRGTLFNEIIRIAEVKKPTWMLLENVKGLTFKPHEQTFKKILSELDRIGYVVKWKVLNSKDYGIPQNRERVWFVCFRDKSEYDSFTWPEKEELKIFIKDILETEVNNKYYLSDKLQERFRKYLEEKSVVLNPFNKKQSLVFTRSGYETDMSVPEIGEANRIYGTNGVSPPIKASQLKIYDNHRKDEIREYEDVSFTLSQAMGTGGNNVPMVQAQISNCSPREVGFKDLCPCLAARDYKDPKIVSGTITQAFGRSGCSKEELRSAELNLNVTGNLRRLTPRECFRLMGFLNDEINLNGLSDTQKYKLAGNGWDINLVSKIFKEMFKQ